MKTSMFVVSLLALVKTLAVTYGLFFLLLLIFNDHFDAFDRGEGVFLYIFFGLFFTTVAGTGYVFAILLPAYYIDRKKMEAVEAPELISRHSPIITLVLLVFAFFAYLIAGKKGMDNGWVQANFFSAFVMTYCGLIFFIYQVKTALKKHNGQSNLPPQA